MKRIFSKNILAVLASTFAITLMMFSFVASPALASAFMFPEGAKIDERYLGNGIYCDYDELKSANRFYTKDGCHLYTVEGWYASNNNWYFLYDGYITKSSFIMDGNEWYYVDAQGRAVKNQWVHYTENGRDDWYYFGNDYKMVKNRIIARNGKYSYVDANGPVWKKGWILYNNTWYLAYNSYLVTNKWVQTGGYWYYLDSKGALVTNQIIKFDMQHYAYVGSNGAMVHNTHVYYNGNWYYFNNNGYMVTNAWVTDIDSGYRYHYNSQGIYDKKALI